MSPSFNQMVEAGLRPVEKIAGKHSHPKNQNDQWREHADFTRADIQVLAEMLGNHLSIAAKKYPLHGPQHVDRAQHDTGHRQAGKYPVGLKAAEQDQELANKAIGQWHGNARKRNDHE